MIRDRQVLEVELGPVRAVVTPVAENAFRVRFAGKNAPSEPSRVLRNHGSVPENVTSRVRVVDDRTEGSISTPGGTLRIEKISGRITLESADGTLLTRDIPARRRVPDGTGIATCAFEGASGEYLFGSGQFQDGHFNLKDLPRRLTQVNSQISIPVLVSSRGYGIFWHNYGLTDLNPTTEQVVLSRTSIDSSTTVVDVTSAAGTVQEARRVGVFHATFSVPESARYACMLDVGAKMARRWNVRIDDAPVVDYTNFWLPPTTSWHSQLNEGRHSVTVTGEWDDKPVFSLRPSSDDLVLSSPVARSLDFFLIVGSPDRIVGALRDLTGDVPLFPEWAYGYIHCRERFHSQRELLDTATEFRTRQIPADVIVQDWQYWGRHGWNAMRFDEQHYDDPAAMVDVLHENHFRLMLSVWSKVDRATEVGSDLAANNCYIPDTDWVDFFRPEAAARYWNHFRTNLVPIGIDAWWLDATEPENDDLDDRVTAAGPGAEVRNCYPYYVTRTVYRGLRADAPGKRVMILTRCAYPGVQANAAATWSGDIGADWHALRAQIPAGLNYVITGLPYWTTDCGGFFRPGERQFSDPAYHELFIRWFQFSTFCPLLRVHGYQTDTEPWNYGTEVEHAVRRFLDLRYRLLPYIYSSAAAVTLDRSTLMRPLIMDFCNDSDALDQKYEYLFGPSLLVRPVTEPGRTTQPVYLPPTAGGWHDFWSGRPVGIDREGQSATDRIAPGTANETGGFIDVPLALDMVPLFVKAGAIIPFGPHAYYAPANSGSELELRVYPGADGEFTLYEDDGSTYDYEHGAFARVKISWVDSERSLTLHRRIGAYSGPPAGRTIHVVIVGESHGGGIDPADRIDATIAYVGTEVRVAL